MAVRTGIPTLHTLAKLMCRALGKFTPKLLVLYDDPAFIAALSAATAACAVLNQELEKVREYETFG